MSRNRKKAPPKGFCDPGILSRTREKGDAAVRILIVEPKQRPEERPAILRQPCVVLACNDERKLADLPPSRGLWDRDGQMYGIRHIFPVRFSRKL